MKDDHSKTLEVIAYTADRIADEHQPACGVSVLMRAVGGAARAALASGGGPAQVATPAYRDNWENLFGKKQPVGQA